MAIYLAPLAVTAGLSVLAAVLPWRFQSLPCGTVCRVLGATLLLAELSWWAVLASRAMRGEWTAATGLPLELCELRGPAPAAGTLRDRPAPRL